MENTKILGLPRESFKKYRTLITSLIVLVLLASISILISLYLSSQYNKAFGRYSAMSTGLELHRNLSNALNGVVNTNNTPEMRKEFAKIAVQTYDQLVKFYPALVNGGRIDYGYNKLQRQLDIPTTLDGADKQHVLSMQEKANRILLIPHKKPIDDLRKVTMQTFANTETSDAINSIIKHELLIEDKLFLDGYTLTNAYRDSLMKRANTIDKINTYLPLASILVLLLYFGGVGISNLRRLIRSDSEVEAARRETDDIMKNVNTGLFLLDKDLKIGSQYSTQLEKILGSKEIAGQNLTKILSNKVSAKDLETTSEFVEQLYNALVREKLLGDLNPLQRIMVVDDQRKTHYLDFKFSRVYHGKEIDKVLVSVQDITEQVKLEQKLEQERAQNSLQVDMLSSILNISPAVTEEFINDTKQNISKINSILKQSGSSQAVLMDKLNAMYRIMHSIKGEASVLNLHNFVKIASDFEEKLKALQDKPNLSGNEFLPLTIHLDEMLQLTNTIDALGKRISESAVHRTTKSESVTAESNQLTDDISVLPKNDNVEIVNKTQFYQKLIENIALRKNKKVILTINGLEETQLPKTIESTLKEINIQLLRNAVVHGIETPIVRLENDKPEVGHITMSLSETATDYKVTVEDDGQGINYESIRQRAIEMGYDKNDIMQLTDDKLVALLFKPGFSTAKTDDEDAGRGMGMDIVKERIKELNGEIAINTQAGKFTRFSINIPKI